MKKSLICIFALVIFLSACGKPEFMDKAADDGKFYYSNKDLFFDLRLPKEFEYFQTQRNNTNNYIEIEFYIPTSDPAYTSATPPSYARPISLRIFPKEYWNAESSADIRSEYREMVERDGQIYAIKFWSEQPTDWKDKWSNEMSLEILENFEVSN